jgi:antitoxin PrlF
MTTVLTVKGQVTIPKPIRDALGLKPGTPVNFGVNKEGQVVILKAQKTAAKVQDRFEAARGKADVKWRTKELMALLRGDD